MKKLLSFLLVMVISVMAIIAFVPPVKAEAATEFDWLFPVDNGGEIYCVYGYSNRYYNNSKFHTGLDIHAKSGGDDTIYSAVEGIVTWVSNSCTHVNAAREGSESYGKCSHGYGNVICVRTERADGTTYELVYAHLQYNSILVKNGQSVKKGQALATMGSSGNSTGKHLHFQANSGGSTININPNAGFVKYSYTGSGCDCKSENDFTDDGICRKCNTLFDWQSTLNSEAMGTYRVLNTFTPRTDAPYDVANKASYTVEKDDHVRVLASITNAHGNKWYKILCDNGQVGYVFHSHLKLIVHDQLNVTCTGFTPTENESLPLEKGYPVWGTVSSNYPLSKVVAKLDGSEYATWTAADDNTASFEVNPSDINQNLKFGSLSAGKHTITLIATDIHGRTQTFLVRSFNMVSTSCSHSYSSSYSKDANNHWKVCSKCGSSASVEAHVYSNSCDTSCNTCGYTRTITHTYSNDCDASCNVCGATRTAIHSYKRNSNADYHWQECTSCGEKTNSTEHIWIITPFEQHHTFTCGECYYAMILDHEYSNNCDTSCNVCGATRVTSHEYDNACDKDCNICGAKRTTNHKYSNACDKTCDACGAVRTVPDHVYDHGCDSSCNNCGYSRPTNHSYDNNCDSDCNTCGAIRSVSHSYTSSYFSDDTTHWRQCSSCGHKGYIENHIPGAPATETNPQKCLACEYVIQPALGHTHSFVDTYYSDEYQHWHQCTDESCGAKKDIGNHVFGQAEVTKEPTTTEKGEKTYTCSVCGETKYEEIDVISGGIGNIDNVEKPGNGEPSGVEVNPLGKTEIITVVLAAVATSSVAVTCTVLIMNKKSAKIKKKRSDSEGDGVDGDSESEE